MSPNLVLSIFPGIDLLGRAFEEEGFCIVRGPDLLWGGDIRTFHPPAGVFGGIIGGPPCQAHSRMVHMVRKVHGEKSVAEDLIPQFIRVVTEARPNWFVMENAPDSPEPRIEGYETESIKLNNRLFGAEQNRERRVTFGSRGNVHFVRELELWAPVNGNYETAVLSTSRTVAVKLDKNHKPKPRTVEEKPRSIARMLELQGFPPTLLDKAPFTDSGKRKVIANGVSFEMGRALARAVKRAMEKEMQSA